MYFCVIVHWLLYKRLRAKFPDNMRALRIRIHVRHAIINYEGARWAEVLPVNINFLPIANNNYFLIILNLVSQK